MTYSLHNVCKDAAGGAESVAAAAAFKMKECDS